MAFLKNKDDLNRFVLEKLAKKQNPQQNQLLPNLKNRLMQKRTKPNA